MHPTADFHTSKLACAVLICSALSVSAVQAQPGLFTDSGQALGFLVSTDVALGDLDGDGLLDAFVANEGPNSVWLGDGAGLFFDSGQSLGASDSRGVALGDLNGDNALDAFVANDQVNAIWLNDGTGSFSDSGLFLDDGGKDVVLFDYDGDGDLDAYLSRGPGYENLLLSNRWVESGALQFIDVASEAGVTAFAQNSRGLCVADTEGPGDNDPDLVVLGEGEAGLFENSGDGTFVDISVFSGVSGVVDATACALGELLGNGRPDLFVTTAAGGRVWANQGANVFADSGQLLGALPGLGVALGDLDGGGGSDAFVANDGANEIWLNDGAGAFIDSGQALGGSRSLGVALGDVDGDGDLDAFVANDGPNSVWWNLTLTPLSDEDGDGIEDVSDVCPETSIPEDVPTRRLGVNRFALVDGDGVFDTFRRNGAGGHETFTIEGTAGCSCEQIIEELGLGNGHREFGCSIGAMEDWVELVSGP